MREFVKKIPENNQNQTDQILNQFGRNINNIVEKLDELGWCTDDFGMNYKKITYVLENKIFSPKVKWLFHGTSNNYLNSIRKFGLNNGKVQESINHGNMMKIENATTQTPDFSIALSFAKSTSQKKGGNPIIFAWKTKKNFSIKFMPRSKEVISTKKLWISLDEGKTWSKLN